MRIPLLILFLALSALFAFPVVPSESNRAPSQFLNSGPSGTTDYPWVAFHFDQFRDGITAASGPASASLMWSYPTGNIVYPSPIIADGYVFIPSYDGTLYALDEYTGSLIWSFATGGNVYATPAVANGIVYVASKNGHVYALDEHTGSVIWNLANDNLTPVVSSPVVADGMVFYGTFESPSAGFSEVVAVNAQTGSVVWKYDVLSEYVEGGASVNNGRVFIGAGFPSSAYVLALNETTGASLWSYNTGISTSISTTPAIASGRLYVGLDSTALIALNQTTGGLVWSFATPGGSNATSPAANGGVIYFGTGARVVYALNAATGAQIWTRTTGGAVTSSPALALGSNTLFVGSNDHYLYALNVATGAVLWRYLSGGQISSSPAVANGRVFFGSKDHKVYALGATAPTLYDTIVSSASVLEPGKNATLTITVRNSTTPQSTATLTLSSSAGGTLSQPVLISAGTYQANFIAPMVTSATVTIIQVSASLTGYLTASNQTSITINAPPLYLTVISNSTALKPGFNATMTITVRNSTALQSGANVTLTSTAGGTISQPVLVSAGTYHANFTAPTVTSTTLTDIQVTASIVGYLSAVGQLSITINPFPILTVVVSPKPSSITPGGEITLMVRITNGTQLISGASLQLSSSAGGSFYSITDSGNGNYTVIFTTPLQTSNPVVTVRASKTDFTTGQGQTTVVVTGLPNLTTLKVAGTSFFLLVAVGVVIFLLLLAVIVRRKKTKYRYPAAKDAFSY